jgi:hypothetical protein
MNNFKNLILPVGDAEATFAKVAMAEAMGREMAKEAAKVVKLKLLRSAISKKKKLLKSQTDKLKNLQGKAKTIAEKDIDFQRSEITRLEAIRAKAGEVNRKVSGTRFKSQEIKDSKSKKLMDEATSPLAKSENVAYKTTRTFRKQKLRLGEHNRAVNPNKKPAKAPNKVTEPAEEVVKKKKNKKVKWFQDDRVLMGTAAGAGGGILASSLLGD